MLLSDFGSTHNHRGDRSFSVTPSRAVHGKHAESGCNGSCPLTPRQAEVLRLIREGATNKQIASTLGVAEGTVKVHCGAIFRVLGVRNRTQAALTRCSS